MSTDQVILAVSTTLVRGPIRIDGQVLITYALIHVTESGSTLTFPMEPVSLN
jgi:hypothetical protein